MKPPSLFVKEVQTDGWRISYYSGFPLMASFSNGNPENVPLLVTDYYCTVCVNAFRFEDDMSNPEGELLCIHKTLMHRHEPGRTVELSPEELDDEDAWRDYREHQAERRAVMRGVA